MKTILLPFLLALPIPASAAEPVVTLAGIQAVFDDGGESFGGFKTFNTEKGLRVALIIRSGDKEMTGLAGDTATIDIGGAKAESRFFGARAFSEDRRALRLEFGTMDEVKASPDGGVRITGEIKVNIAAGKEETRSAPFAAKEGAVLVFPADMKDAPTLKVKSTGKPDFGDDPFAITFSTDRKPDDFAGIRFYTKEGKEVESERRGSSWMSFAGKGSGEIEYSFKQAHGELILAVENWTGQEQKTVKIDLDAGLAVTK